MGNEGSKTDALDSKGKGDFNEDEDWKVRTAVAGCVGLLGGVGGWGGGGGTGGSRDRGAEAGLSRLLRMRRRTSKRSCKSRKGLRGHLRRRLLRARTSEGALYCVCVNRLRLWTEGS